jgi:hypothetical protein
MITEEKKTIATRELWNVAETDRVDQLETLLQNGVDINASNSHGTNALMIAAARGRERMVSALLANGADPNLSRNDKFTALLLASFFGHEEIVKLLVNRGADPDASSRFETSAQMWATCRNFHDVADYLEHLKTGSDAGEVVVEDPESCDEDQSEIVLVATETELPVEDKEPGETDVELPAFDGRKPLAARLPLKWGIAVSASAILLLVLFLLTDFAIRREEGPKQATSETSPTPSTGNNSSVVAESIQVKPPPSDTKVEDSKEVSSDSNVYKQQKELRPKTVAGEVVPTQEPTKTNPAEKQSVVTNPPLPERSPDRTRTPESPVQSSTSKPEAVSRDRTTTRPPVPAANQLLTGPKSSTPTGKVIRWP